MPFRRANFELLAPLPAHQNDNIRTYPELLAFNAAHNGSSLFCLQGVRDCSAPAVRISFAAMQQAVERCKSWLVTHIPGIEQPRIDSSGTVVKCPAVGILMGSDVGIIIYMMGLLALGVPVCVLLFLQIGHWLTYVCRRLCSCRHD